MGDPRPRQPNDRNREALTFAVRAAIELAGTAVGVPHIAVLKALISGPTPDSLVSLVNQTQGFVIGEAQVPFEQLSSKLTSVTDVTSPLEKAGAKALDAIPSSETPTSSITSPDEGKLHDAKTDQVSEVKVPDKRQAEQARLEAIKQELERISWELNVIGARVRSVTRQDVVHFQFDDSEAAVKVTRRRLRNLMPGQLEDLARILGQVITELYAQDPQQQKAMQEKLQTQYHRIVENHKLLVLAFDELEKKFVEAHSI